MHPLQANVGPSSSPLGKPREMQFTFSREAIGLLGKVSTRHRLTEVNNR
jgi:hypothetical protein